MLSRIPVEGLVDIYTGSEGDTIQIVVDENNVISAIHMMIEYYFELQVIKI